MGGAVGRDAGGGEQGARGGKQAKQSCTHLKKMGVLAGPVTVSLEKEPVPALCVNFASTTVLPVPRVPPEGTPAVP